MGSPLPCPLSGWVGGEGVPLATPVTPRVCLCPPPRALPQATVKHLLPEIKPQDASKLCVVIDLDETLVHSSFKVGDAPAPSTSPAPPRPSPICSATPHPPQAMPGTQEQHPAQPCWGGWGVRPCFGGCGAGRGCVAGRGQAALGQGVPAWR